MDKKRKGRLDIRKIRLFSQILFFSIFIFLILETVSKGKNELGYPVKVFLELDPLIFFANLFSTRSTLSLPFLSLYVVFITIFLGRIFCGYICPLGLTNDLFGLLGKSGRKIKERWLSIKYYILFFLLTASFFSLNISGIFDPLCILIRSFALSIYPLFLNSVGLGLVHLQKVSYNQSFFFAFIIFAIWGLNLVERRFYCKYVCPLGALLGLFSIFSLVRRGKRENCKECGICEKSCAGGLFYKKGSFSISECIQCASCEYGCPYSTVQKKTTKVQIVSLERRALVFSILSGFSLPNLLNPQRYFHPNLLRPPGSLAEEEFLKRCVRCGQCMKVCPTNGLQPSLLEAGLRGIWTPILVPRIGYCELKCTLCGKVCPVGAITELKEEEKERTKIGTAFIDKGRCLPYAFGRNCIVCEEVCPTSKKAIWLEEKEITAREGERKRILFPNVDPELCVGCGICEAKCPVRDRPAIYVTSIGESRSEKSRFLL